jgi:transcriptional regulator with XRE-family HTH domain
VKTALKEELDAWREQGPLRVWRRENDLSLSDAAGLLDCGISSVQRIEAGLREPGGEMLESIARVMNRQPATIRGRFRRWIDDKPQL